MTKSFDLPSFIAFVASKDAGERYDFIGATAPCALHQFLLSAGYPVAGVRGFGQWRDTEGEIHDSGIDPKGLILGCPPYTFGALLQRLKALS